jgi:hypothetical protein
MSGQINTGKIIKKVNLIFAAIYIFSGVWSLISGISGLIFIFIPICTMYALNLIPKVWVVIF